MEFSVRCPSPPNTYSYERKKLGSTRKFVQNYLLFTCIFILILAIHMQSVNWLDEPFKTLEKSSSSPRAAGVKCCSIICTLQWLSLINNDVILCCLWIAVLFCAAQEKEFFNKKWEWNDSPRTLKWQQNDHPIQISILWTAFFDAFCIGFVLLKDWRFG